MSLLVTRRRIIGSHLVEQLLAASDEPLVVLDNFNAYYDPRLTKETRPLGGKFAVDAGARRLWRCGHG